MSPLATVVLLLTARAALLCPDSNWVATGDGDCYLPLPGDLFKTTAEDAEVACRDFEPTATLPEVHNYEDQLTLDQLADGLAVWLGLYRDSEYDPWFWPSSNVSYYRWATDNPDEDIFLGDCAYTKDSYWYNMDCVNSTFSVVCFTTDEALEE
ncbi:CD302 antigen-like [Amphibalanus amphitrite]|uniref:CD302 antigen-like n=1 Tax=Amphibalanus amphitrite TaxID=1232801 RepID=UPI001C91D01E|nr:CD302 antigen-like [Amphibalanus amphitrite]